MVYIYIYMSIYFPSTYIYTACISHLPLSADGYQESGPITLILSGKTYHCHFSDIFWNDIFGQFGFSLVSKLLPQNNRTLWSFSGCMLKKQMMTIYLTLRYMHTYIHAYIHTYIHIFIHIYIYGSIYIYMYIGGNIYIYVNFSIYIHM